MAFLSSWDELLRGLHTGMWKWAKQRLALSTVPVHCSTYINVSRFWVMYSNTMKALLRLDIVVTLNIEGKTVSLRLQAPQEHPIIISAS